MKLFIAECTVLEPSNGDFRERVLAVVKQAENQVLDFLRKREITSRGSTAVRKRLHVAGALNNLIARHRKPLQAGAIQDPDRQYLLKPMNTAL
ncbi:hypothetical protein PC129_g13782 [Phytophthora cactorum]|uniref:Uncharacterized protein n=1 Tax=Phytophthora cactorum TaxID=29920 RepID=A0A329RLW0_9STRA|nr:hypothetical protein Pcac1_g7643 [Phytophthora cactorum]KAG2802631.1 hypothetical protein PC111_g19026 [Phytophthora cactorum]KAG2829887.1 hypothetical protein PC112_g7930 [Phytophthora cactorum]KAG2841495.1 hypothetical protein PC113_g19016 [Phytophthora cactorum]KAG2891258.1 hypothetical protein PC115_g19262 [Phytophthora cactorum]